LIKVFGEKKGLWQTNHKHLKPSDQNPTQSGLNQAATQCGPKPSTTGDSP